MVSILGNPGQTAYGGANAFLDGVMRMRRASGLCGTAVNWGPWAEIGMAVNQTAALDRLKARGWLPLAPETALRRLQAAMETGSAQVVIAEMDWRLAGRGAQASADPFLKAFERIAAAPKSAHAMAGRQEPSWREVLAKSAPDRRRASLHKLVHALVAAVMKLNPDEPIDDRKPLQELGLDSLLAVELGNKMGTASGLSLAPTVLFDYPTVSALSDFLLASLYPESSPSRAASRQESDDEAKPLPRLQGLTDAQLANLIHAQIASAMGDQAL